VHKVLLTLKKILIYIKAKVFFVKKNKAILKIGLLVFYVTKKAKFITSISKLNV